jgi:hypothetical protein
MSNDSEAYMTQITLQYMINKKQYGKFVEKKVSVAAEERQEYKDQFLSMTQNLLDNKETENLPTDLKLAFENFLKTAIQHFKHLGCDSDSNSISNSNNSIYKDCAVVDGDLDSSTSDQEEAEEDAEENLYHESEDDDMYM